MTKTHNKMTKTNKIELKALRVKTLVKQVKSSIEHVCVFLSKDISKGAVDMKFSPDVDNNVTNP